MFRGCLTAPELLRLPGLSPFAVSEETHRAVSREQAFSPPSIPILSAHPRCDPMRRLSHILNRLSAALNGISEWILIVIGVAMSIVVLMQIFFRFVVYLPFPWSEEIARYLMIWLGMIGSFVALRRGRHIGVTIFMERVPQRVNVVLFPLIQGIMIVFLLYVAREGWTMALANLTQKSPAMQIPMFYPYVAVPFGAVLMIIELLAALLHQFFPTEAGMNRMDASQTL